MYRGLWFLGFTSQFALYSPVKAPLFLIRFVVTVRRKKRGQPRGYGTVTDMPHPSIQGSGNNDAVLRNVYTGRHVGLKPALIMGHLGLNAALNLLET